MKFKKKIKNLSILTVVILVLTISSGYKSDFFEIAKQIEIYTTLFKELNLYYIDETNPAELTETAISSMLEDLDPYTHFYDEQGVEKAKINAAGEFGGIGAETIIIDDKLIIAESFEKGPADIAGIKAGDVILKINDVTVDKDALQEAMNLLNGTPNSTVALELDRNGKSISKQITREKIEMNPVPYYHMIDQETGYIAFIKFNTKASVKVREAFENLKAQGMKKLILDVRGNPGGLLNEAVEITNFFIPKDEIVVTTKAKVKKWSDTYKTKREPVDLEIPIVVLIDGRSASASEILAGSLQDLDRAVIMGERSFGKGLVQRYRPLTYGTQLKLTISKYYTPSGRSIQELDYTHRDEDGYVPKFSEKKRNAFKTRNGRTVFDGGGIEPDIKLSGNDLNEATKALLNSHAIFNYATNYYYNNPSVKAPEDFDFKDTDFQNFIEGLQKGNISFSTRTEDQLNKVLRNADKDGFNDDFDIEYKQLLTKIRQIKTKEILKNKETVKELLADEIVRRYYYKKGEYIYKVYNDNIILEATKLMKEMNRYQRILAK